MIVLYRDRSIEEMLMGICSFNMRRIYESEMATKSVCSSSYSSR